MSSHEYASAAGTAGTTGTTGTASGAASVGGMAAATAAAAPLATRGVDLAPGFYRFLVDSDEPEDYAGWDHGYEDDSAGGAGASAMESGSEGVAVRKPGPRGPRGPQRWQTSVRLDVKAVAGRVRLGISAAPSANGGAETAPAPAAEGVSEGAMAPLPSGEERVVQCSLQLVTRRIKLCGTMGCMLPDRHAGLHQLPDMDEPRKRRRAA